ncbi:MAG: type II toxin-antitoxin system RelE/ParE family toxin [Polyangiaceae bacterium]|nr:type II toxin-antitoxin system RelE/ParE family toxin [Polyangiaceae bacterium]MBK8941028.1 type II toxin-antitoxin system RelE/ParE family toxin [Polyangiaceae bacterium]
MRYKFTASARRDVDRAARWWLENRPEAPTALVDELAAALEQLCAHPESAPPYGTWRNRTVRRTYLPTTRRHLYFAPIDEILIVLRVCGAEREHAPRFGKKSTLS